MPQLFSSIKFFSFGRFTSLNRVKVRVTLQAWYDVSFVPTLRQH